MGLSTDIELITLRANFTRIEEITNYDCSQWHRQQWVTTDNSGLSVGAVSEAAAPNLTEAQVLKVLLARDAIEELLTNKTELSKTDIITLIQLDERLRTQGKRSPGVSS